MLIGVLESPVTLRKIKKKCSTFIHKLDEIASSPSLFLGTLKGRGQSVVPACTGGERWSLLLPQEFLLGGSPTSLQTRW